MSLWAVIEIKSIDKFSKLLIAVGVIQSLSVFASFIFPSFREFITNTFMSDAFLSKVEESYLPQVARINGIGIAWSSGSLVLAFCCLPLIWLRLNDKIGLIPFSLFYATIMGGTALMGRTGLIVEFCFLLFVFSRFKHISDFFAISFVVILGFSLLLRLLSILDPAMSETTKEWIFGFLNGDALTNTNDGITKGGFPPFCSDFIFGTGVYFGHIKNYSFFADSGYIRSYTSIGVIGMLCYYLGTYRMLTSAISRIKYKSDRVLLFFSVIILFLIEYKEPFIKMFIYTWVVFTMGILMALNQQSGKIFFKQC